MKIVQVMPEFGLAGAETMCESLTYELIKLGHNVTVISMYDYHSAITQRLEQAGVDVRYLGKKAGLDFSMIPKMRRVFKEIGADAVHTHRYCAQYAIPAAMLAGVKHRVHTLHSIAAKENNRIARKLNKFFFKYCKLIPVALSEKVKETVIEEYGINPQKVPVVYNGVPLDKCLLKNNCCIDKNKINILHIGRFTLAKNHIEMINAFCELKKKYEGITLNLIGDGELKKQVEEHISLCQAEDFVKMLGLKDNVFPYLQKADVFILPSVYEGIPMTLIEAMGSGVPIVASRVGGIPDMITDGQEGLLCEPTSQSIAEAVDRMIADESLRKLCSENARDKAQLFSAKTMGEKYERLYQ